MCNVDFSTLTFLKSFHLFFLIPIRINMIGITAFIKACYKLQCSDEFIISELMSNFSLSQEIAQSYLEKSDKTS